MEDDKPLSYLGTKLFNESKAEVIVEIGAVKILYDNQHRSCKIIIDNFVLPKDAGYGIDDAALVVDTAAYFLQYMGFNDLATNLIGAYSRFRLKVA